MDYRIGLNLIDEKLEKEIDDKLWDKWLMIYPNMTKENFINFDDFKEEHKPKKPLSKSDKSRIDKKADRINKKVNNKKSNKLNEREKNNRQKGKQNK